MIIASAWCFLHPAQIVETLILLEDQLPAAHRSLVFGMLFHGSPTYGAGFEVPVGLTVSFITLLSQRK
jgi:hypothetical protein